MRALQLTLAILVSVVCVLLSLVDTGLGDLVHPAVLSAALVRIPATLAHIGATLGHANWFGFLAVCALTIGTLWMRAVRWRDFVGAPVRVEPLFSAVMIGFMANNVLPFRLGEFVRPWVLARRERLPNSMLLATVVVERVIDMLTLLGIFACALLVHPIAEDTDAGRMVQGGAHVLLALSISLTVFVVVAERRRGLALGLVRLLPTSMRPSAERLAHRFLDGFALFRDLGKLAKVLVLSVAMNLVSALAVWLAAASLDIPLPWHAGLVMLVVTNLGIMVPAAPGYVGTLNIACTAGLALYGIARLPASAYGWFYFLTQWVPITLVGLVYLHREQLSLGSLGAAREEASA